MQRSKLLREWDLNLTILISTLSIISYFALPLGDVIRAILVLPLIIFLPGYALVCIVFPFTSSKPIQSDDTIVDEKIQKEPFKPMRAQKGEEKEKKRKKEPFRLEPFMRIGLAFILSIALSSILQFLFNELYTLDEDIFGLRPQPTIIALFLFTIEMSIGAIVIRAKRNEKDHEKETSTVRRRTPSDLRSTILTVVLAIVLISSISFTFYRLYERGEKGEIELYLLGKDGEIRDYPDLLTVNRIYSIIVGVHDPNQEKGSLVLQITTFSQASPDAVEIMDPQVFNKSTSVKKGVDHIEDGRMEYLLNFTFNEPGEYSINFILLSGGKSIRHTWLNVLALLEEHVWTNEDNNNQVFIADEEGSPFISKNKILFQEPLSLLLTIRNKDNHRFGPNLTVYLGNQTLDRWSTISLNGVQNITFNIHPPSVIFCNETNLGPHSKVSVLLRIDFPPGIWNLRIGINERSTNYSLKMDIQNR